MNRLVLYFVLMSILPAKAQTYYEGYVKDAVTKAPLKGVNVVAVIDFEKGKAFEVKTDKHGFYSVKLPWLDKNVQIIYEGFPRESVTKEILVTKKESEENNNRVKAPDVLLNIPAKPDQVICRGKVVDENGKNLEDVHVSRLRAIVYTTSKDGEYIVIFLKGNQNVKHRFSKVGYIPKEVEITLDSLGKVMALPDVILKKEIKQ